MSSLNAPFSNGDWGGPCVAGAGERLGEDEQLRQ